MSAAAPTSVSPKAFDPGWPREVTKEGYKLVYYQPQIDQWREYRELTGRVAFSITPRGASTVLGVAMLSAKTQTDLEKRAVVVKSIAIQRTGFPSHPADEKQLDASFRKLFPTTGMTVSLDRMLAAAPGSPTPPKPVVVKTDPPEIFTSQDPSVLLHVDGDPVRADIDRTSLQFVVNANWDVFFDKNSSTYFLLADTTWLAAPALAGPWNVATTLPADLQELPARENWDIRRAISPQAAKGKPPRVFFSDKPAELIVFAGEPVYKVLKNTPLVYAANTNGDLFVHNGESQYYFLDAGRWFRAKKPQGPWSYVGNSLPMAFTRISSDFPKAYILAAVPGTKEAKDAIQLAQIPTSVIVNKRKAQTMVVVNYEGNPKFAPIVSTSLTYATNTREKVIHTGGLYYVCYQGIWFLSKSPKGPWQTADRIPPEIATIPPSSPVYNVTYVKVCDPTDTTVTALYTSGYLGTFIAGCVVHGTGWNYSPALAHASYCPYPFTYGVHAIYEQMIGRYVTDARWSGPYGASGTSAWNRSSTVGQSPHGARSMAQTYDPYTGGYLAIPKGSSPYSQWEKGAVLGVTDWAAANGVAMRQGNALGVAKKDELYAGKDGSIYRRDQNGAWHRYEAAGWVHVHTGPAGNQFSKGPVTTSVPTDVLRDADARR